MERFEHALKNGGCLNVAKRKPAIGKNQIYALRDKEGNVTTDVAKIVKVAGEFYRNLYSSRGKQDDNGRRISPEELDIPPVTPEEVKKALYAMQRGKACRWFGSDNSRSLEGWGADNSRKTGYPVYAMPHGLERSKSWKNANIILIHYKVDAKDMRNYRQISLLSVAYKVFTKVIANRITTTLDFNQPTE